MTTFLILGYLAVAIVLALTQRRRWIEWQERDFKILTRKGDYAAGFYLYVCAFWPIAWPVTLLEMRDHDHSAPLNRFLLRGRNDHA